MPLQNFNKFQIPFYVKSNPNMLATVRYNRCFQLVWNFLNRVAPKISIRNSFIFIPIHTKDIKLNFFDAANAFLFLKI
jgi:hypothetical protein